MLNLAIRMPRILLFFLLLLQSWGYSQKIYNLDKVDQSEIIIDGIISEDERKKSLKTTVDYEWEPGYNTPARLETELYMSYNESSLYVGVIAYGDPENIRGQVRPRDQMEGDLNEDTIFLRFDPFQAAGGGIAKLAGDSSGAMLESMNPDSQGLRSLKKRVKTT